MRLKVPGSTAATYSAAVAAVLALAAVGFVVATGGLPGKGPVADGDGSGHYTEPADRADESARALRGTLTTPPPSPRAHTLPGGAPPAVSGPDGARTEVTAVDPLPASVPLQARETSPSPAVGPLFYTGQGEPGHSCTASVVHSPRGDLLITAAHCVYQDGFRTDIAFAPGYHDGQAPYGVWVPTAIDVDPSWTADRDEDHDVAFLRVRRADEDPQGTTRTPVEHVTGAQRLAFHPQAHRPARVLGYPSDSERPVDCQNTTDTSGPAQLRFDCRDMPNGTSGSPVLTDVDPATGLGTVNGVIGGRDEGGDDETSYSSYFGDDIEALYRRAVS
ncbi:trypsin-like serine peptidase [Streptomyces gamaensis]|uniref:Trypsin-like serine peptidase n=1 Tax=Streptomyces gamaensis TaxID=1763542 RepID=A0ABW0YW44_9ACTN